MATIYVEIEEQVGVSEEIKSEFKSSFDENISCSDNCNLLFVQSLFESVGVEDKYFNLFLREDSEFWGVLEDFKERNKGEYKNWLISVPVNDNFALFRTVKFDISDDFEVYNGETEILNEDERDNILRCSLTDGYLKTTVSGQKAIKILMDYRHITGNISFDVLSNGIQKYHYCFSPTENDWRIIEINCVKDENEEVVLKFSGNGEFYLHCIAMLKERSNVLPNPTKFKFDYQEPVVEVNNNFKKEATYLIIDRRTYTKKSTAAWGYLTANQYNYLKKIFNLPIVIKRHDFYLQPALITSMDIDYDRLGRGVIAKLQMKLF